MAKNFWDELKTKIIIDAGEVNRYAAEKDARRNAVNYGFISAYSNIVREMGHEIEIAIWEDNGFLKIPKVTIDGEVIEYADGK